MSEPLEKLTFEHNGYRFVPNDEVIAATLNAAIDRINSQDEQIEVQLLILDTFAKAFDELEAKYSEHHHHLHDGQNTETTPPTNNGAEGTRGGESE